ncbi:MAG: C10 family peptidase [Bacteroidales bacterium]|nr:C10 family peptidase [Candidatus Liminaster caballi]
MKKILLSLIAIIACLPAGAAVRTRMQAKLEAERWFAQHQLQADGMMAPRAAALEAVESPEPMLYIYNNVYEPGFVIVSASDLMRPVLAYSLDNGFVNDDEQPMPDNLRSWLRWVAQAAEYLEEHPECALTAEQMAATVEPVTPLMSNIKWAQDSPYNAYCPSLGDGKHAAVGCLATAAAQCAYYHRYPAQGRGSHQYYRNVNGTQLSVNYEQQTYNYNLMFDTYTTGATTAQCEEVAKLSYHCGVMADMEYGLASGANDFFIRRGLVENFGYDPLCQVQSREGYTYDEWQALLVNELKHRRPIIFCGQSDAGGHAFVLDGINNRGYYHVNWGWSGMYNGFYDVAVLNPGGAGIGAGMSTDGFSTLQTALLQLAPEGKVTDGRFYTSLQGVRANESSEAGWITISTQQADLGGDINISTSMLYNNSVENQVGYFKIVLMKDGNIVATSPVTSSGLVTVPGSEYQTYGYVTLYATKLTNATAKLPTNVPDGNYRLYLGFSPASGMFADSTAIVRFTALNKASYYDCEVSNGKAVLSQHKYGIKLSTSNWSCDGATYRQNSKSEITCTVRNNDPDNTIAGRYYLRLTSPAGAETIVETDKVETLAPGDSVSLTFRNTFTSLGSWTSRLYVFIQNVDVSPSVNRRLIEDSPRQINVAADSTASASFTLTGSPTLVLNEAYGDSLFIGHEAAFDVEVENLGGPYLGQFQIQFIKSSLSSTPVGTVTADVSFPMGEKKSVTVRGPLEPTGIASFNVSESGTRYYVRATYLYGANFRVFNTASGVSNTVKVTVYQGDPSGGTGIENVTADETASLLPAYDLYGRRITVQGSAGDLKRPVIQNGKIRMNR